MSNPANIVPMGSYTTNCSTSGDVAVDGNIAILACGDTFHFIDVSTALPFSFVQRRVSATSQSANAAAIRGNSSFLASESEVVSLSGLTTVDVRPLDGVGKLVAPAEGHVVAAAGDGGIHQWRVATIQ